MKKCINEMLNLQGLLTDKVEVLEKDKTVIVHCRSARRVAKCPVCLSGSNKIHQTKKRKIKHGVLNYREVFLNLTVRRFKCRKCKKVFTEQFIGIDRRM